MLIENAKFLTRLSELFIPPIVTKSFVTSLPSRSTVHTDMGELNPIPVSPGTSYSQKKSRLFIRSITF